MRVNFPNCSIVNSTAKRLRAYIRDIDGTLSIDGARNIVSQCYGYQSYRDLSSNLSSGPPQFESLSQTDIETLNKQQIQRLALCFHVSGKEAKELWMAMTPYVELATSNWRLKIGQIGRETDEWGQPDEYGEDTEYVNVYIFVIAIQCPHCKGTGKIDAEIIEQDFDLESPPTYSEKWCDDCDGTGIFHSPDEKLNKIRLSEEELEIQHRHDSYYQELEDKRHKVPDIFIRREDDYTGWDEEHDEDNPDMDL